MSISAGEPTRSVRSYRGLLIVGGEGHTTGAKGAAAERYDALERFARAHWDVDAVTHRWSAQDLVPYDHLPIVGRYTPRSSRLYVASGFMKWGLSGGTMAAILLSDLIRRP
jgi:glycine/D-amino acid oxidase-like deaminating enzyme